GPLRSRPRALSSGRSIDSQTSAEPHEGEAPCAVEEIQEMEGKADGGETDPASPPQQPIEAPIDGDNHEQRDGHQQEEDRPPEREHGADEGKNRQARAHPLRGPEVELARYAIFREDEARPRHGAARHVGPDHGRERPALEMRALELPVEENPSSRSAEAVGELYILHGRPRESGRIEAADLPEVDAANGAEPGPEGGRGRAALLMDEVVKQVAIARDEPRRSR